MNIDDGLTLGLVLLLFVAAFALFCLGYALLTGQMQFEVK